MKIKLMVTDLKKVYFQIVDEWSEVAEYTTNYAGEGLWKWDGCTGRWRQIVGTCQFDLLQKTPSGKRRAIRRFFEA